VAALLTTAAGGLTLLDNTFRESWPGWQVAWDRAKPLGLSETVGGLTVGVERAYMDASQVIIGLTTEGYHYAHADLLVDGRNVSGGTAEGVPTENGSVAVLIFHTPPSVGDRASLVLEVTGLYGPGLHPVTIDGPWRFAFDLPNAGGTTWNGAVTDVASSVTMTLDGLTVSPTLITGSLKWSGGPLRRSLDSDWWVTGRVGHAGDRFQIERSEGVGDSTDFSIRRGSDTADGDWTVRIDQLSSDVGYPPQRIHIAGPWVLKVSMTH
jgi:hypothetical protein